MVSWLESAPLRVLPNFLHNEHGGGGQKQGSNR